MKVPPILGGLAGDAVKVDLIEKHWEDLLRLAVSVGGLPTPEQPRARAPRGRTVAKIGVHAGLAA
jgi:hypothetical protein